MRKSALPEGNNKKFPLNELMETEIINNSIQSKTINYD